MSFLAVLAVAAGLANLGSDGGGRAPDDEASAQIDTSLIIPAGPTDGLDSLHLPITVEPAGNLVDGQTVTVAGAGFPPNTSLGVVMCSGAVELGGGAAQCQLAPFTQVQSNRDGTFSVEYRVRREILIGGVEIDCADPPGSGIATTCVIAVGALDDYDQSGMSPVGFDASIPVPLSYEPAIDAGVGD